MVIYMLMGEYHHNIDDKLRLIIPSSFREQLGNQVVITRGLENSLFVYSIIEWQKIIDKFKELPFTKQDARGFMRIFLSGATICEFDKQGRIKLTEPLKTYASLKKECCIIGVSDRLEIWDNEAWSAYFNKNKKDLSDLADHLFDVNF